MNFKSDCGIVYVAFGEKSVEEAALSAASAKTHMPDIPTTVFTGEHVTQPCFDQVLNCQPRSHPAIDKETGFNNYNKIYYLRQSPYRYTLYLDTDTYVARPVYEVFLTLERFDLNVVHGPPRGVTWITRPGPVWHTQPEINAGAIGFRKNELMNAMFSDWLALMIERCPTGPENFSDQTVLRELLTRHEPKMMIYPVEYNCRVGTPNQLNGPVKILHGRPRQGVARHAEFMNLDTGLRIYFASIGLFCFRPDHIIYRPFDEPEAEIKYTFQELKTLLASGLTS